MHQIQILSLLLFLSANTIYASGFFSPGRSEMHNEVQEIPLEYHNGLYFVEIETEGRKGLYLLDFGAQGLVLDRNTFPDIDYSEAEFNSAIRGEFRGGRTTIREARLLGLRIFKQPAFIVDLHHLQSRELKVHGLVGISIFSDFEITVDLKNRRLVLYKLDCMGNPVRQTHFQCYNSQSIVPIAFRNGVVILEGQVAGEGAQFVLDSGAEYNVINSKSKRIKDDGFREVGTIRMRASGGGLKTVKTGLIEDLQVGEVELEFIQGVSTNLFHMQRAYGVGFDGLLGIEFLERAELTINFHHKLLSIQPS